MSFLDNIVNELIKSLEPIRDEDNIVKFEIEVHNTHKTKTVDIDNENKEIDEKIADLILLLNQSGIETSCSYQGDDNKVAYLTFSLKGLEYSYNEKYNELTFRWIIPNTRIYSEK